MAINSFLALGDITGESRDPESADTIDVIAWSFGMSQSELRTLGPGAEVAR